MSAAFFFIPNTHRSTHRCLYTWKCFLEKINPEKECCRNRVEWVALKRFLPKLFGVYFHDLAYPRNALLSIITIISFLSSIYFWLESDQNFGWLILVIKEKMAIFKCYPKQNISFWWKIRGQNCSKRDNLKGVYSNLIWNQIQVIILYNRGFFTIKSTGAHICHIFSSKLNICFVQTNKFVIAQ